jgi:L-threonylcarbamoyladenylate synthase
MRIYKKFASDLALEIKSGAVAVIPTDTIYGIVASAFSDSSVKKVYELKNRNPNKACIILLADAEEVVDFSVDENYIDQAGQYWPGAFSIILPTTKAPEYLLCGQNSLAFRVPDNLELREFLKTSGPLIAPSANIEGQDPARDIEQAQAYFADKLDFYVDAGELVSSPSKIISLVSGKPQVLRP